MGLITDSSVVLDKLNTIDDTLVVKLIGHCPASTMQAVDTALRHALDLNAVPAGGEVLKTVRSLGGRLVRAFKR